MDVLGVLHQLVVHLLHQMGAASAQFRQIPQNIFHQMEPIHLVLYPHVEGSGDGALLLITVHMDVAVMAAVSQLVDKGVVAVERENNGLIRGKQRIVLRITESMRMLRRCV